MKHLLFVLLVSSLIAPSLPAAWVWGEGEQAVTTNIGKHPWYYGQVKKAELSGGDFLAHFDQAKPGEAEYVFNIPSAGQYTLWLRANPTQATMKYSLNGSPLAPIDFANSQTSVVNIAANNAPDLRFLAWSEVGKFPLQAGANTLRFVTDSANNNHGAIDCFVFTNEPFVPNGAFKPDQLAEQMKKVAAENQGWVSWNPAPDDFKPSPIDLRFLNEKFAGENGFIQVRGEQFVHQKGNKPVRFWAVNGPPNELKGEALKRAFQTLAKHGVNMIRMHGGCYDKKTGALDTEVVKHKQEIIEAAKAEGIYTHLSIYFPLWMSPENGPGWREGYAGEKPPFVTLYFEPEFQQLYRSWWKEILTTKGPSGKALVDDPALMSLELVNEDSFFFWTFNYSHVPDVQMRKLEKLFGDWASKKHGSLDKALAAWRGVTHKRDTASEGRLGFRTLHEIFSQKTPRDQETAAFLMETQQKFYAETVQYLRRLGFKGLITASNWTTANNDVLGPLEKYSYTPGDFIDRHGYFGCNHKGENAAWSLRAGHTYSDVSALRFDSEEPGKPKSFNHPAMDVMVNSMPSMISETTWNRPNRYRGEAPLFYAVYGALQGTDSVVHFALDTATWQVKPAFFMQPWTLMSPTQMGQFPAAAFIYRQGLVKIGDLMADLPMKLEDILALKGTKLVQQANLDELRKADVVKGGTTTSEGAIDPLIHLVGRTHLRIDEKGGPSQIKPLASFINRDAQTVVSSTGEIKLDYGKGFLTVNAPSAQAASGNLKAGGPADLKDVVISSELELGHIVAVSLDGRPLAVSSKILVQAMTEEKASKFATESLGNGVMRVTDIGQDPWLFRDIQGTVAFKRPDAARLKVTALDFNGYPVSEVGQANKFNLLPDKVYYLIQK
jgi:hypothetical protein